MLARGDDLRAVEPGGAVDAAVADEHDVVAAGEPARILQVTFPSGPGRWGLRRSTFREHGLPMQLLVIGDLTRPLREEELQAWQRLVRVLGHELNNSLTPIKSIAGSLENLVAIDTLPPDCRAMP